MKLIDFTGRRVGMVTVIKLQEKLDTNGIWMCRCDCGKQFTVKHSSLRAGRPHSCGCLLHKSNSKLGVSAGRTYHRLLVTSEAPRRGRNLHRRWVCMCDCGATVTARGCDLVSGAKRSCGCLSRENAAVHGKIMFSQAKGLRHPRWNPALTERQRLERRSLKEQEWGTRILKRDNYTCDLCGQTKGNMRAHHLNCYRDFPDQRTDLSNGITLCESCHRNFHSHMGGSAKRCTREDYVLYKAAKVPAVVANA